MTPSTGRKVLFIHVPKTAGSTLKTFFKRTLDDFVVQANSPEQLAQRDPQVVRVRDLADVQQVLNTRGGLALHVDSTFDDVRRTTDFRSLAGLLFEPTNYAYFEQFTILTMFRHPFRRFMSDFAFVRRMKDADAGFLPDLDVTSPAAYLDQHHPNALLHFLLERDLHERRVMRVDDLEQVKERMASYPIHVGIHERFDESIGYFARLLDRRFAAGELGAHNVGTGLPEADPALEAAFARRNPLDLQLYDYAVRAFAARAAS